MGQSRPLIWLQHTSRVIHTICMQIANDVERLCNCSCLSEYSVIAIALTFFPATGDFCPELITFANGLYPDQDRQNVGPDLDPKRLTL